MNQNFMKEKPVMPLVISMALPMTFSMLVNALYNIIDSYFVARISEDAMTALSLVFPLQNLVNAVVIGFAIGINATIAYFLGAQKQNTADKAASLGTLFNMIHGLILAVVCIAAAAPFLAMFTDKRSIIDMGAAVLQSLPCSLTQPLFRIQAVLPHAPQTVHHTDYALRQVSIHNAHLWADEALSFAPLYRSAVHFLPQRNNLRSSDTPQYGSLPQNIFLLFHNSQDAPHRGLKRLQCAVTHSYVQADGRTSHKQ